MTDRNTAMNGNLTASRSCGGDRHTLPTGASAAAGRNGGRHTTLAAVLALVVAAGALPHSWNQGVLGGPVGGTPATQLLPVDEAASQPDFFAFRARLQAALARRDLDAVLTMVAPDIKNSFGADGGREGFLRQWTPRDPGSRLWEELATVLALGGTFDTSGQFVAPYVFGRWPDAFDPFDHVAFVGADVRTRAAPRADAAVLGWGSFVIVPLVHGSGRDNPEGWTAIRRGDSQPGYVASTLVRSPIDYRAFFARRDGRWEMVMFLAGD